jgi:hypothetical protein
MVITIGLKNDLLGATPNFPTKKPTSTSEKEFRPSTGSVGGIKSIITPAKKPAIAPTIGPLAIAQAQTNTKIRSGVEPGKFNLVKKIGCSNVAINIVSTTANQRR